MMGRWRDEWNAWRVADTKALIVEEHERSSSRKRSARTLCFFSHHARGNQIDPYVLSYLAALKAASCDIIFITTMAAAPVSDREAVLHFARKWIQRRDIGGHFGSWRVGIEQNWGQRDRYDQFLFVDNSRYCLTDNLKDLLQEAATKRLEVWSVTENLEGRRASHQCYCWGVRRSALRSEFLPYFWREHHRFHSRPQTIKRRYEQKLWPLAQRFAHTVGVLFETEFLLNQARKASQPGQQALAHSVSAKRCKPTQHLAHTLLVKNRMPLVRRDLLLHDPMQTGLADEIAHWAEQHVPHAWPQVAAHLQQCRERERQAQQALVGAAADAERNPDTSKSASSEPDKSGSEQQQAAAKAKVAETSDKPEKAEKV